jgi:hypothetical protein
MSGARRKQRRLGCVLSFNLGDLGRIVRSRPHCGGRAIPRGSACRRSTSLAAANLDAFHVILRELHRRFHLDANQVPVAALQHEVNFAVRGSAVIEANGQLKDIRVNDKFLARTGCYELICGEGRLIAHQRLGRTAVVQRESVR